MPPMWTAPCRRRGGASVGRADRHAPIERGRMVQAMGRYLLEHKDEIARVLTLEQGKPLWEAGSRSRARRAISSITATRPSTVEGRSIPLGAGYFDWTEYEPFGVSAQIIPWNYPVEMTARSLSAALATGNACVIKTPELTPLTNAWFARAAEAAGFPPGAVNVLCGWGTRPARRWRRTRTSTRSSSPARCPPASPSPRRRRNVVPCVLELGGKSAAIVHDDADLDAFETDIRWGIYFNAGQVCSAMSRVIVHESRHDELVERAEKVAKSLSVGPGIERPEFGANMGAMVSEAQRDRAAGMVETAPRRRARAS
jgi:aldehyde dehydrogenase (NAD+)